VGSDASTPAPRRRAVPRLAQFALEHLLLLPLGAVVALLWVNLDAESYYRFSLASAFIVNDIAMVFFFGLVMKEVVEATALGGVLHPWRRALLPVIAAIGATIVPALIYRQAVDLLDEPVLAMAWPVSFVTDIAMSYFIARIIFPRHPAVPFLLLLAIASDAAGFLALALTEASGDLHLARGALLMAVALGIAYALRRARVRSFWPYLVLAGGLSWYALLQSGLHPALALAPIMPFLPHAKRDPGFFVDAKPTDRDALSQFEVWWRYPVQLALLFFGLVNAGVPFRSLEAGTWGVPIAVILGKPIGIMIAAAGALALGLHLPERLSWRDLTVIGLAAAVSFSIGLYFSAALLPPGQLRSETEMGVLLCLAAAPLALAAAKLLRVGRFSRQV
jgi:Na+:H+ antiporter, NhaA family